MFLCLQRAKVQKSEAPAKLFTIIIIFPVSFPNEKNPKVNTLKNKS